MKIRLKNVGRIKDSEVEIKTITVIAGENGSGKSTVGKALCGVFDGLYNIRERVKRKREDRLKEIFKDFASELFWRITSIDKRKKNLLEKFYKKTDEIVLDEENLKNFVSLPQKEGATEEKIRKVCSLFFKKLTEGDHELFEISYENFLQSVFFERLVKVLSFSDIEMIYELVTQTLNAEFNNQISNIFVGEKGAKIEFELKGQVLSVDLVDNIVQTIDGFRMLQRLFYIDDPFVLDELDDLRRGLKHRTILRNYLRADHIIGLFDSLDGRKNLSNVFKLFDDVCEGSLIRENTTFYYSSKKHPAKLNIRNIATGMKTFVILKTLVQKGLVQENGTIILDEPEIHLHPDWQVKLAEIIVVLQKALKLHILINTHSPYFLNAIEVFSKEYGVGECRYYLAEKIDDFASEIKDVTHDTGVVYAKLAKPFRLLEEKRVELEER